MSRTRGGRGASPRGIDSRAPSVPGRGVGRRTGGRPFAAASAPLRSGGHEIEAPGGADLDRAARGLAGRWSRLPSERLVRSCSHSIGQFYRWTRGRAAIMIGRPEEDALSNHAPQRSRQGPRPAHVRRGAGVVPFRRASRVRRGVGRRSPPSAVCAGVPASRRSGQAARRGRRLVSSARAARDRAPRAARSEGPRKDHPTGGEREEPRGLP